MAATERAPTPAAIVRAMEGIRMIGMIAVNLRVRDAILSRVGPSPHRHVTVWWVARV
jgi:hypothetical protein